MIKPEILSPAGDFLKLRMAIQYGADAVYLAGDVFGMRTASKNFDEKELRDAVLYAHARSVRVYVTLNTMPRDDEITALPAFLKALSDIGVDAVIVADIGVFRMVQRFAPKLHIHISTQASVVNSESARAWYELGAARIVLARELSLSDIARIRENTPRELELEAFVHGAMCMSYSGRCLLSSFMTGRDANRGNCAQPCRWKYSLREETRPHEFFDIYEDGGSYILNSKDLCMVRHIPELVAAGITSFKIEGRVKTGFYGATITNAYRMALDSYFDDPQGFDPDGAWASEVQKVSHREYYTGFYFGDSDGQHSEDSSYIRDYGIAAMVMSCDDDGMAVISQKNRFFRGDTLELLEPGLPSVAFVVAEMHDMDGAPLDVAPHAMMQIRLKLPRVACEGAILRREKCDTDD